MNRMARIEMPNAPTAGTVQLRGDYSAAGADFVVAQAWDEYTPAQHALWARLLDRQLVMVQRYGAPQFLEGLRRLGLARQIPHFDDASRVLRRATGWEAETIAGLDAELPLPEISVTIPLAAIYAR